MKRKRPKIAGKVGFPPGTLVHVGTRHDEPTRCRVLVYDSNHVDEYAAASVDDLLPLKRSGAVFWAQISGVADAGAIGKIATLFGIHPLVAEDIMNTIQRPKLEEFENYLFVNMRAPLLKGSEDELEFEQVSLIFGDGFVLSFTESDLPLFEPVADRVLKGKGLIKGRGADFLAYSLIDIMVDQFFVVLEKLGEQVEFLDEELVIEPSPAFLREIHLLKRDMLYLHKAIWPVREIIGSLDRCTLSFCSKETSPYFRDAYDHVIQVIDMVETYRDMVSGMLDIYLSSVSYKLNEVMKVLTIISTIFIPLSFIAGVYGMNFENMPELKWPNAYYGVLGLMLAIALGMVRYFWVKKWL